MNSTITQEHLLSPTEAAERLGVSTATARRWAVSGELEAVRLCRGNLARIRITESAFDEFVRPAAEEAEGPET